MAHAMVVALAAIVGVAISSSAAEAEIVGAGPDETIQQAYGPLDQSVNYSGAFTGPADIDYLAFEVASAGESLHFTVSNTMQSCDSPDEDYCPLYATLMDQTNNQVGGDNSGAGTVATFNDTETIDWTFAQPGTYYVLMESNGNLPAGEPTYTVGIGPPPTAAPPAAPIVQSLAVARHQRGSWVRARIELGRLAASLRVTLIAVDRRGREANVASWTRHPVSARTYGIAIRLPTSYRRRLQTGHGLSLLLKLTILSNVGARRSYIRAVTLTR